MSSPGDKIYADLMRAATAEARIEFLKGLIAFVDSGGADDLCIELQKEVEALRINAKLTEQRMKGGL